MTNTTFAQALANVLALSDADKALMLQTLVALATAPTTSAQVSTPAPVEVVAPKRESTADAPKDCEVPYTVVKANTRTFVVTLGYSKECARNAHTAAKNVLKAGGFAWDTAYADGKRKGAFVGTAKQAQALGLSADGGCISVSKAQVQEVADKKAAKAARKSA